MALHWVQNWLWNINTIVPPFCVELVLKDGSRYYLHSALQKRGGNANRSRPDLGFSSL